MPDRKPQQLLLAVAFLAAIFSVGLFQAGLEVSRGRRPKLLDLFRKAPTAANFRSYEKELDQACWLTQHTRPAMQFLRFMALKETPEQVLSGRRPWFFYRPAVQYYVEPFPPQHLSGQMPDDPVPAIQAYRNELARRGIHLLVVLVPNKAGVYPEMLAARAGSADPPVYAHTLRVYARLREAGIEMVDLHALYARARAENPETLYYLPADTHWSPQGMRLAADAVARHVLDCGWLTRGAARHRLQTVTIRRQGDLLDMLENPWIAGLYTPAEVECSRVVSAEDGRPLADDPTAEVLVLGDSFLRIYQRDEPGGAGFVSHLAYELQRGVASIIGDGGASTLVRQELCRRPGLLKNKKLVIWEFVERDVRYGTEGWQVVPLPQEVVEPTKPVAEGGRQSAEVVRDDAVTRLAEEVRSKGWIVFSARSEKGDWDLFLCRPDGSGPRNLTRTPDCNETSGQFSRDGKRLLYRRLDRNEKIDHSRSGAQGKPVISRSDGSGATALGARGDYPWANWSPDGQEIACLSIKGIYFVDVASRKVVRTLPRKGFFQQLTWSPDGQWLSGVSNALGPSWSIGRMAVATGEANVVSAVDCCTPDWFPDSRNIIFSNRPRGQKTNNGYGWTQLWMADAEGTSRRLVYGEDGRHVYGGHVSPDGKYVLFTGNMVENGDAGNAGEPMGLMRLADAPIIGGQSQELRRLHPKVNNGPVLVLPQGWEPCWTYSEIGAAR